jgi:hypothetical protein
MTVLSWDKPLRAMPVEEWASWQADSAPPGTYVPNMSDADIRKWKAKKVGFKAGHPQIEIRKDSTVVVVSLGGGYKYKYYTPERTEGINVHIATAGPIQWTWQEFAELQKAVAEARAILEEEARP